MTFTNITAYEIHMLIVSVPCLVLAAGIIVAAWMRIEGDGNENGQSS